MKVKTLVKKAEDLFVDHCDYSIQILIKHPEHGLIVRELDLYDPAFDVFLEEFAERTVADWEFFIHHVTGEFAYMNLVIRLKEDRKNESI